MALVKLDFKPGIDKENTSYSTEGGWEDADKIRFRAGRPEKIGGWDKYIASQVEGIVRKLHVWRVLDGTIYLGIGTTEKFYVETGNELYDVTPIRETFSSTATDNCLETTETDSLLKVNLTSHGAIENDWVTISGVTGSTGGLKSFSTEGTASGSIFFYQDVSQTSTSGTGSGATFLVSKIFGSYIVLLYARGSGYAVGDTVTIAGTSLGGTSPANDLTFTVTATVEHFNDFPIEWINKEHQIYSIEDADSFNLYMGYASYNTGSGGGTNIEAEFQLNAGREDGLFQYGWGAGAWGESAWGEPRDGAGIFTDPALWSVANWGEDLIINRRGIGLYQWDASNPSSRVTQIDNAPHKCNHIVVTKDRHLVCFGCNLPGETNAATGLDTMQIRWCAQEDFSDWTVTATNTAGDQLLTGGTRIMGAADIEGQTIVWTDDDVHSMQFVGPPYTFAFQQVGTASGIVSPNAWAAYNNAVFWMGDNSFYVYASGVQALPCTLHRYVFDNLTDDQKLKTFAVLDRDNHEISWFYPATSRESTILNEAVSDSYFYTIIVSSTAGFPPSGVIQIEDEIITYSSKTDTRFTGTGRGARGTTLAAHPKGAVVFSPDGDWTSEPYHYVTYSVTEKVWWNGGLERTAWVDQGALKYPVASSPDGYLYNHEKGTDADGDPLTARIESADFDLGEGDSLMFISRVIPDFTITGEVDLKFRTRYYPLSDQVNETVGTVDNTTRKIDTRIRGRQMSLVIESDQVGDHWKYGSTRIEQRPDGKR